MRDWRWFIVWVLVGGGFVFLVYTLYQKATINRGDRSQYHAGEKYNLIELDAAQLDSLRVSDEYLFDLNRAVHYHQIGKSDSALVCLQRAFQLNPKAAFVNCRLAETFIDLKQYDSALYYSNRALQISPGYSVAKYYKDVAEHRKNGDEDFDWYRQLPLAADQRKKISL
jgi:tetratricopeptide (TPR) repeat protein